MILTQPEDSLIPFFKTIVYSRSWVRKLVNCLLKWPTFCADCNKSLHGLACSSYFIPPKTSWVFDSTTVRPGFVRTMRWILNCNKRLTCSIFRVSIFQPVLIDAWKIHFEGVSIIRCQRSVGCAEH